MVSMRRRRQRVSSLTQKFLVLAVFAGAILVGILLAVRTSSDSTGPQNKDPKANSSTQNTSNQQVQQLTQGQSKPQTSTASSVAVPPTFTVYYPASVLPSGLLANKSSIGYSQDSFNFAVAQNGQEQFYVYEQPAGNNFSFQRLKVRLGSPTEITTGLGSGIFGTIGTNLVTAVKTDKNTLIILNCTALACTVPSKQIIESLKVNTNPTQIR